jgi:hypothetical protein
MGRRAGPGIFDSRFAIFEQRASAVVPQTGLWRTRAGSLTIESESGARTSTGSVESHEASGSGAKKHGTPREGTRPTKPVGAMILTAVAVGYLLIATPWLGLAGLGGFSPVEIHRSPW